MIKFDIKYYIFVFYMKNTRRKTKNRQKKGKYVNKTKRHYNKGKRRVSQKGG